jgi:hypothetical protein
MGFQFLAFSIGEYNRKELAEAAVGTPELFVDLAHKVEGLSGTVDGLEQAVDSLADSNLRIVGFLIPNNQEKCKNAL